MWAEHRNEEGAGFQGPRFVSVSQHAGDSFQQFFLALFISFPLEILKFIYTLSNGFCKQTKESVKLKDNFPVFFYLIHY